MLSSTVKLSCNSNSIAKLALSVKCMTACQCIWSIEHINSAHDMNRPDSDPANRRSFTHAMNSSTTVSPRKLALSKCLHFFCADMRKPTFCDNEASSKSKCQNNNIYTSLTGNPFQTSSRQNTSSKFRLRKLLANSNTSSAISACICTRGHQVQNNLLQIPMLKRQVFCQCSPTL